jgi:hypothetical protein
MMVTAKEVGRLRLMMGHVNRTLESDEPDLKIVEKLLSDALSFVLALQEPPNPYADKALRPGLTVGDAAASGMIAPPEGGL